ncbi:MAG TPA: hypothetical protein VII56_01450 [Rhizomicrobium sp.]
MTRMRFSSGGIKRSLFALALVALGLAGIAFAGQEPPAAVTTAMPPAMPMEKGTPLIVKVAVAYVDLESFDENAGTFKATVDVRLRWEVPSLARPAEEQSDPPKIFRGDDAKAQLANLWVPTIEIANQKGDATYTNLGLRIFPNGDVEMIKRITAEFATPYEVTRFPFDRQKLQIEPAIRNQTADQVVLQFDQDDLDFSTVSEDAALNGWTLKTIGLKSEPIKGWYGAMHTRVVAALTIARLPGSVLASIFIPLFASLLIPLLAIWLNHMEDGEFKIETFELVNLIIGGLFAVIALNFTVNQAYQVLSTGDNPVNRLFALNYVTLGLALAINVLFYRFNVVEKLFGRWAQEQTYTYLTWAIPVLVLTTASAVVLVAMA